MTLSSKKTTMPRPPHQPQVPDAPSPAPIPAPNLAPVPCPILWTFRRCPYAMRARLALKSSRTHVILREIRLKNKPQEFLNDSPKATVPVLKQTDGTIIDQSIDIMHWALEQNDPEAWRDVLEKKPASCAAFLKTLDGTFKDALDRYKYASRYKDDETHTLAQRAIGADFLSQINETLNLNPFLSGAKGGFLDYASLPFIRQFRGVDPKWFDAQDWPALHPWLQDFLASPRFEAVMSKYQPWTDSDPDIFF